MFQQKTKVTQTRAHTQEHKTNMTMYFRPVDPSAVNPLRNLHGQGAEV